MTPPQLRYRADIDGLRAVAVVAVVLFHARVAPFSGGYVGVDVFFVISGFLITSLLLHGSEDGRLQIVAFYARRVRRIVPALAVLLAVLGAAALFLYLPTYLVEFGKRLFATALFIGNFKFWRSFDYFAPQASEMELVHLWSLAVEEQFYILFPLFIWALRRVGGDRGLAWGLVAAIVASLAVSVIGLFWHPVANFYLLPGRAWELLLGAMLALPAMPRPGPRIASASSAGGLALIVGAVFLYSVTTPFPGPAALIPCLGGAAILWAGLGGHRGPAARLLASAPLAFVGRISYSLYLWHWPLLLLPGFYLGRALAPGETALAIAAAFLVSVLSWRFVEMPFRRRRDPSPRRTIAGGVAFLLLLAALGLLFWRSGGLPARLSPHALAAERAAFDYRLETSCIGESETLADRCGDGTVEVALWGDSHAEHFLPAFRAAAPNRRVALYGAAGCPPLLDATVVALPARGPLVAPADRREAERCRSANRAILDSLRRRPELRLVVLAGAWQAFSEGAELGTGEPRFLTDSETRAFSVTASRAVLARSLERTVRALRSAGIAVLILGDIPESRDLVPRCLAYARMFGRSDVHCAIPAGAALERLRFSDRLVADLAHRHSAAVFLPSSHLCAADICRIALPAGVLYRDGDHLTSTGARSLAPRLDQRLFDALPRASGETAEW